ncbi:MAG: type 4a pilus biogenesis protein PilO [Candidatus Omnitrophota bacterium]
MSSNLDKNTIKYLLPIIIFAFLGFWVTPEQIKKSLKISKELKKLKEQKAVIDSNVFSKDDFIRTKNAIENDVAEIKNKVITMQDISSLQAYLSEKAKEKGLEIANMNSSTSKTAVEIGENNYFTLTNKIEFTGGYHNLGQFLNEIENGTYLLGIKNISLMGNKPVHSIHMEIVVPIVDNK